MEEGKLSNKIQELHQQSCYIFLSCIHISKSKSLEIESILEGATKVFSAEWEHKKYAESAASSALEQLLHRSGTDRR